MDYELGIHAVRVPLEGCNYIPTPHIIFHGKGKNAQRFIFAHQQLTELENEKLSRLETELQKCEINPYDLHREWSRNDLLRFCYGTGWKTRVAKEVFLKYLKWTQSIMPDGYIPLYPKISQLLVKYK